MSLLVKGMDVPDINDYNGISCCLYKTLGGQLRLRNNETGEFFDVVYVQLHGDLVDREALMDDIICSMVLSGRKAPKEAAIVQEVLDIVGDANAIIPAEEGDAE